VTPPAVTVAKPTISGGSLTGVPALKARLRFTLAAGVSMPAITTISVSLPRGLSFSTSAKALRRGIVITNARGKKLKARAKVHARALTIVIGAATAKAVVTISSPAISVGHALAKSAQNEKDKTLTVLVRAIDTGEATTQLPLKLSL
jgi:hypothetical protein